ncbi:magnesium transporter [Candidatus Micrarchaeota archaeon]|nr:magnesium transporter [Candidatus Micrarchaeota archaeon]
MKDYRKHLEQVKALKRRHSHPLLHHLHKKFNISRKTLFYVKEYGPHANVPKTIVDEGIKILLLASVISSFGGLALENFKQAFVSFVPLVVLLPVLNDLIGDFGTLISAKFSVLLHEGVVGSQLWRNKSVVRLFYQTFYVALFAAVISSVLAILLSLFSNYFVSLDVVLKVMLITVLDVTALVALVFFTAIIAGKHFYDKGEDPNNFLIPITTSVADFGNMIFLTVMFLVLF